MAVSRWPRWLCLCAALAWAGCAREQEFQVFDFTYQNLTTDPDCTRNQNCGQLPDLEEGDPINLGAKWFVVGEDEAYRLIWRNRLRAERASDGSLEFVYRLPTIELDGLYVGHTDDGGWIIGDEDLDGRPQEWTCVPTSDGVEYTCEKLSNGSYGPALPVFLLASGSVRFDDMRCGSRRIERGDEVEFKVGLEPSAGSEILEMAMTLPRDATAPFQTDTPVRFVPPCEDDATCPWSFPSPGNGFGLDRAPAPDVGKLMSVWCD